MKKHPQAALVGAGNLSDGPFGRLPGLPKYLGPVKAASLRVASRFANALRAGHPVPGYLDFEFCPLVFISVPDEIAADTIQAMAESGLCWRGRLVVLCSNSLSVELLTPLAKAEASTASFGLVPGFEDWFLLEGEKSAARMLRPMMGARHKVMLVGAGQKPACVHSLAALSSALLPLIRDAAEAFRAAELSNPDIEQVLERHIERMLRTYFRSGLKNSGTE